MMGRTLVGTYTKILAQVETNPAMGREKEQRLVDVLHQAIRDFLNDDYQDLHVEVIP